jgi:hypothetical protein
MHGSLLLSTCTTRARRSFLGDSSSTSLGQTTPIDWLRIRPLVPTSVRWVVAANNILLVAIFRTTYYSLRYFVPKNEGNGARFSPTTSSIITTRNFVFWAPVGLLNIFPSLIRSAGISSSSPVARRLSLYSFLLVGTLSNPHKFDSFRITPRSY